MVTAFETSSDSGWMDRWLEKRENTIEAAQNLFNAA
jgi:hypothetical protein